MKALLCTHHFDTWSGSELVCLELAEALSEDGWEIAFFCPFDRDGFADAVLSAQFHRYETAEAIGDLADFDLVYVQHNMHARFLSWQARDALIGPEAPKFVFNHLSPFERFESPVTISEAVLADLILANSPETAAQYRRLGGQFEEMVVMPNPAPAAYESARRSREVGALKRLLVVSNHLPPEAVEAIAMLEDQGVGIERIGLPGKSRRVLPSDLAEADAVLTIGKTTQYAVRAGCPVYLYDHFGGPGWLTPAGFASAEASNFSGRDAGQPKSAQVICDELAVIPSEALAAVEDAPERFRLEYWIEKIVAPAAPKKRDALLSLDAPVLALENVAADHIDFLFSEVRRFRQAYQKSSARNKALRETVEKLRRAAKQ